MQTTDLQKLLVHVKSHASSNLGPLLPLLMRACHVKTCLEIGVCEGFLTAVIGHSLSPAKGVLISVDVNPKCAELVVNNPAISSIRCRFRILTEDSRTVDWRTRLQPYEREFADLAVVDGCHAYEYVRDDLANLLPAMAPNGLIVCHDYDPRAEPGVFRAVNEFKARERYAAMVLPHDNETASRASCILVPYLSAPLEDPTP